VSVDAANIDNFL